MKQGVAPARVFGSCDRRFEAVRDAFADNFHIRDEVGASLCVAIGDRIVVDLWGGFADEARTRQWAADTLVNVFSVGKAFTKLCVQRMVGQGRLDLDDPLAGIW